MAQNADDKLDNVITGVMSAIVGVIMVCAVMVPIVSSVLDGMFDGSVFLYNSNLETITTMVPILVILTMVGLILAVVRRFSTSR